MPYSVPAPPPAPLPIHSHGRPGHRRSYTNAGLAHERAPGPFAPLAALPRRRAATHQPTVQTRRLPVFHLNDHDNDDDDESSSLDDMVEDVDDVLHNIPPALKLKPTNSFGLSTIEDASSPRNKPFPSRDSPATATASVPFPRSSSSTHSPPTVSLPPPTAYPPRPNVIRTTSTPILLSNGKPLKSSLKSSSSSPHIPSSPKYEAPSASPPQSLGHLRARSAPSTPNIDHPVHKNVHFPTNEEGGLATVRLFNRSARPANLLRPNGEDTETETEGELSTGSGSGAFIRGSSAVFPFPRSPLGQDKQIKYEVDPTLSSPVPAVHPPPYANVYLESLTFDASLPGAGSKTPPGLSGTLLVRNIAYEKHVAVRFTLDDWQTTSEVSARYSISLPSLPPTFLASQQLTFGDIAAQPAPPTVESPQWDRFIFHVKLEDYAFNLSQRTLYLVVRYFANSPGAPVESWDNNNGANYKIAFREASNLPTPRSRVFAVSSPPSFAPASISPPTTTQPQHAHMIAQTTLLRLKKLNLKNYAAPGSSSVSTTQVEAQGQLSSVGDMKTEGGLSARANANAGEAKGAAASAVQIEDGGDEEDSKTPIAHRSRTLSPVSRQDPAVPPESKPSIRVISPSSSSSSTPKTNGPIDIERPPVLSPLEMGTSPPFSMLADLGPSATTETQIYVPRGDSKAPVHWPWGMGNDGKERSEDKVRQVLTDIRVKSTSSPVRRVSPTGRVSPPKQQQQEQGGRSSPLKTSTEGRASPVKESSTSGQASPVKSKFLPPVVSPQPRNLLSGGMPNWSKVGSGWNRGSPVAANHLRQQQQQQRQPSPRLAAPSASTTYTPPYSPTQDSVYQAFVQQWCFAQGPPPPGGRFAGEKDKEGGGQLVV